MASACSTEADDIYVVFKKMLRELQLCVRQGCKRCHDMVHARVLVSPHFDTVHHCSCDCRRLKRFSCGSSSNRLLHAAGFPRTSAFRNTTIDACRHMLRVATSFDGTTPTILTRVTHLSLSRVQVVNTLGLEVKGSLCSLSVWSTWTHCPVKELSVRLRLVRASYKK